MMVVLLVLTIQSTTITRMNSPVVWKTGIAQESNEWLVEFTAIMQKNWHIYSQFIADGGPIATSFKFNESEDYTLVGKVVEPKSTKYFDKNFDMEVKYFSNEVVFKQKIKRNTKSEFSISGVINFMCCDDSKCLPPEDVPFKIEVPQAK